eukprot:1477324-Prymnesium_polylepis.1
MCVGCVGVARRGLGARVFDNLFGETGKRNLISNPYPLSIASIVAPLGEARRRCSRCSPVSCHGSRQAQGGRNTTGGWNTGVSRQTAEAKLVGFGIVERNGPG